MTVIIPGDKLQARLHLILVDFRQTSTNDRRCIFSMASRSIDAQTKRPTDTSTLALTIEQSVYVLLLSADVT